MRSHKELGQQTFPLFTIHMGEAIYKVAISLRQKNRIYIT